MKDTALETTRKAAKMLRGIMTVQEAGRIGGKASAEALTAKQRAERAKKAVAAREGKRGKP